MSKRSSEFPYKILGDRLKKMRQRLQESLAEVSGAVEIELEALDKIEQGKSRPSEDILLLLISHFDVKEDEASSLWELANYDQHEFMPGDKAENEAPAMPPIVFMQAENRVIYSDMVQAQLNSSGVVINFLQSGVNGNQPNVISRVGMSREQATNVVEALNRALAETAPKALPAPKAQPRSSKKSK